MRWPMPFAWMPSATWQASVPGPASQTQREGTSRPLTVGALLASVLNLVSIFTFNR